MESVAVRPFAPFWRALERVDVRAASVWALALALVLYLAFNGGGYDLIVRNQVGIAIWWAVLVGAAGGVLPTRRPSRAASVALALLSGFVVWTAISASSSYSSERSLEELSRVACYLGVFVLAVAIHRDRERAMRHTIGAIACAVVAVAALALYSRLRPGTFTDAQQTASFLPGTSGRLDWPLHYWNALAAMMALGLPLLLAIATTARRLAVRAAAAAGVPVVALCGYLTFSRGGAIAATGAVLVFYSLTGDRIPKLLTGFVTAAGSAALIAGAVHRSAIENGFVNAAARHQGSQLLIAIALVCAGVALAQVGIGLAVRHGTPPRLLQVSRQRARGLTIACVVAGLAIALAAGAPSRLKHSWENFKRPLSASLHQNAIGRFGATSGNGRYDYWRVAVHASSQHLLVGWGPGTYQWIWSSRGPYYSPVRNAHSLYVETLVEDGLVGLALLVGFFALVLGRSVWLVVRSRYEARVHAAAVAAACTAFALSAVFDWVWQVPVLPVAFLLLAAAMFAPRRRSSAELSGLRAVSVRTAMAAAAILSLAAIAVPLASTSAMRQSQAAAAAGDTSKALSDALTAARIEPGAASPQLQQALVLELEGRFAAAVVAARRATADEPLNWSIWLVRSRIEAESGAPALALAAYRRARGLNPRSPVFARVVPRRVTAVPANRVTHKRRRGRVR